MSRDRFNPQLYAKSLPPELVKELKLSSGIENKVLEVFREGGGTLNVSEILVGFYQMHNEVQTRRYITSVLHRMRSKKFIQATGKKGEYAVI